MKTLFLSIGHDWGNGDQGAVSQGTTEAIESKKVIDGVIAKGIPGVTLVKVPERLTLPQRTAWINSQLSKYQEPFAFEMHLDSGPSSAEGASAWYCAGNSYTPVEGKQFLAAYLNVTGEISRHVNPDTADRLGRLGFVRDTKCAALLLELGFISNVGDLQDIRTKAIDGVIAGVLAMNAS